MAMFRKAVLIKYFMPTSKRRNNLFANEGITTKASLTCKIIQSSTYSNHPFDAIRPRLRWFGHLPWNVNKITGIDCIVRFDRQSKPTCKLIACKTNFRVANKLCHAPITPDNIESAQNPMKIPWKACHHKNAVKLNWHLRPNNVLMVWKFHHTFSKWTFSTQSQLFSCPACSFFPILPPQECATKSFSTSNSSQKLCNQPPIPDGRRNPHPSC